MPHPLLLDTVWSVRRSGNNSQFLARVDVAKHGFFQPMEMLQRKTLGPYIYVRPYTTVAALMVDDMIVGKRCGKVSTFAPSLSMAERPALGTENAISHSVLRGGSIPRGRDEYPDAS